MDDGYTDTNGSTRLRILAHKREGKNKKMDAKCQRNLNRKQGRRVRGGLEERICERKANKGKHAMPCLDNCLGLSLWLISLPALFKSLVLALTIGSASSPMPVDHVRDPTTNPLASATASMRARAPRLTGSRVAERWRIDVEAGDSALGSKLAMLSANVKRGDR